MQMLLYEFDKVQPAVKTSKNIMLRHYWKLPEMHADFRCTTYLMSLVLKTTKGVISVR